MNRLKRNVAFNETDRSSGEDQIVWMKIGEVAKRTGIGIETLRFYERSGLLSRPARTEGGYRLYDAEVLTTLDFIKRAQTMGFTLEEIRQIIAESRAGQSPCADVREIVRQRLIELDERLKQMKLYRDELAETLKRWDKRGDVEGHICGLIETTTINTAKPASAQMKRRRK